MLLRGGKGERGGERGREREREGERWGKRERGRNLCVILLHGHCEFTVCAGSGPRISSATLLEVGGLRRNRFGLRASFTSESPGFNLLGS